MFTPQLNAGLRLFPCHSQTDTCLSRSQIRCTLLRGDSGNTFLNSVPSQMSFCCSLFMCQLNVRTRFTVLCGRKLFTIASLSPFILSNIPCIPYMQSFPTCNVSVMTFLVLAYFNIYSLCCSQPPVCLGVESIDRGQPQNNDIS